jgi:APA family basic amino acid/polyamine antiporter
MVQPVVIERETHSRKVSTSKRIKSGEGKKTPGELKVGITAFGAWMVGVGSIIGSMAWLMHGPMLARAGTLPCVLAWTIAAIATVPLAMILMELSSMFPDAGGPYVYKYYALKRLIPAKGEMIGFLTGWLFWMAAIVALACMSNGLANLLCSIFYGSTANSPIWFGPAAIFLLFGATTVGNLLPVGKAASINNVFTVMKLAMAVGFGLLVACTGHVNFERILSVASPQGEVNIWKNVGSVLMIAMAGFSFLEVSGCTSAETADARRVVPKAMGLTLITVTFMYVGMCVAISSVSSFVLSADRSTLVVPGTTFQATCPSLAGMLGGPIAGNIFTGCVVASIVGCAFVALLAVARVSYSMAKTKLFPQQFALLDAKTHVPRYALWFQFWCLCVIGIGANLLSRTGVFSDAYTFLCETFGFMYAFVAMLYGICLISLRYTDPHMERAFRIGAKGNIMAWIVCMVTIAIWTFSAFFCVNWTHQVAGVLILLSGIPIYLHYRKPGSENACSKNLEPIPIEIPTQR